jgi:hypothetical protein
MAAKVSSPLQADGVTISRPHPQTKPRGSGTILPIEGFRRSAAAPAFSVKKARQNHVE